MLALVVAIAIAQTHGIKRGFVCDCAGLERLTQADHCHDELTGVHPQECEMPLTGHPPADDTREHGELTEALMAKVNQANEFAPALALVKVLCAEEWLAMLYVRSWVELDASGEGCGRALDPPSWAERLVREIALRV